MLICMRTDASAGIGLGHLRRCLSLASALSRIGARVVFLSRHADVDVAAMITADGFECRLLDLPRGGAGDRATESRADAEASIQAMAGLAPIWVVVDHYQLDQRWHDSVREATGARIAVIDDLADRPLAPDILIDQNPVARPGDHASKFRSALKRPPSAWLCGPRFALLGPAYEGCTPFAVEPAVRSIGIFLGGTDPGGASARVLAALRRHASFRGPVQVASTSANPRLEELRQAVSRDGRAELVIDQPDLRAFFSRHDLIIGAGGGASWERCCVGVPSVVLQLVPNHAAVVNALAELGACAAPAGDRDEDLGACIVEVVRSVARRESLARRSQQLVDGRGALRVALRLAAMAGPALRLRAATLRDASLIWHWRNHPATRAVSRNGEEIPWAQHDDWMKRRLSLADPRLWIGTVGAVEVGVIRLDAVGAARFEVSLFLDPGLHGLGLGDRLLAGAEAELARQAPAATVVAEVLPANPGSQRLFDNAGYRQIGPTTYEKPLARPVAAIAVAQETPR